MILQAILLALIACVSDLPTKWTAIKKAEAARAEKVTAVSIVPEGPLVVEVKDTALATCEPRNAAGTLLSNLCNWSSSNTAVARVINSKARTTHITGIKAGKARIRAAASGVRSYLDVTVKTELACAASLTISPASATLPAVGDTLRLTIEMINSCDKLDTVTAVTVNTLNPSVASVSMVGSRGAKVTALAEGEAQIVASVVGTPGLADVSLITVGSGGTPPPVAGCNAEGMLRLVEVNTESELTTALGAAIPGDCIKVAAGSYSLDTYSMTKSGTSTNPITIEGEWSGSAPSSVIRLATNAAVYVRGDHIHWRKIRNTQGFWGFALEDGDFAVFDSVQVDSTQRQQIHFKWSHHGTVRRSKFFRSGFSSTRYGEGIYIGGLKPDGTCCDTETNDIVIEDNVFGPNLTAEAVEARTGANNVTVRGNTIDGTGTVFESGAMNSLMAFDGNGVLVEDNTASHGAPNIVDLYSRGAQGNGTIRNNNFALFDYPGVNGEIGIRRIGGTWACSGNDVTNIPTGGTAYSGLTCTGGPPPEDPPPSGVPVAGAPPPSLNTINVSTYTALRSALLNAQPGDSIAVAAGTYTGNYFLEPGNNGTAAHPVVVVCKPGAILQGTTRTTGYVFRIRRAHYQIRNCTITRAQFLIWVEKFGTGSFPYGIVISDNVIHGAHQNAIVMRSARGGAGNHSYIQRNRIYDVGGSLYNEGVYLGTSASADTLGQSDSVRVVLNQFGPNIIDEDVDVKGFTNRRSRGNIIQGNISDATGKVFCDGGTCGSTTHAAFSDQGCDGCLYLDNIVRNISSPHLSAFWWDTSRDSEARRNRAVSSENSYSLSGSGFRIAQFRLSEASIYCDNDGPKSPNTCIP